MIRKVKRHITKVNQPYITIKAGCSVCGAGSLLTIRNGKVSVLDPLPVDYFTQVNGLTVCNSDECKRKAELKAFL